MATRPTVTVTVHLTPEQDQARRARLKAQDRCPGCGAFALDPPGRDCRDPEGCGYIPQSTRPVVKEVK